MTQKWKHIWNFATGFGNFDTVRLNQLFAKRDDNGDIIPDEYVAGYTPITSTESQLLNAIPAVIVGRDFFQDYYYGLDNSGVTKQTEFYNPQTLKRNHFLHAWGVLSSSPFENACVFVTVQPTVTGVTVSPATATVSKGQSIQLSAIVATTGFANQAVTWSVESGKKATIDANGLLKIASDATAEAITITATSVFDNTKTGTATITIAE